jgi:hypothetical protein
MEQLQLRSVVSTNVTLESEVANTTHDVSPIKLTVAEQSHANNQVLMTSTLGFEEEV